MKIAFIENAEGKEHEAEGKELEELFRIAENITEGDLRKIELLLRRPEIQNEDS